MDPYWTAFWPIFLAVVGTCVAVVVLACLIALALVILRALVVEVRRQFGRQR